MEPTAPRFRCGVGFRASQKTLRRRGRDRRSREGTSGAAFVLDDGMAGSAG
ncbi:MAG: hypothetical protein HSCHL_1809 [Hydrogenibacillus schlegelii]|uniref:Uncharacterized protein n=1 Tax=Hydrogenibacillus schlegelii TaxID=1484 RepID=A0A2T5GFA2_HYDSH|nr:MAG: hypothetical protein HSCHL_1809 [Hydrogenibacillus schlegelii]